MTNRGSLSELLTSICHCSFVISHLTENPLLFAKDSCAFSWDRTHPACRAFETRSTLEACPPRYAMRVLRGEACVLVLVAALPRRGLSGHYGRLQVDTRASF